MDSEADSGQTSGQTRERILEVAQSQFAKKGYAGAHLQAIAEEVGVQKTALYYYFPSKSQIYVSVLSQILDDIYRCVRPPLAASDTPHAERLFKTLEDLNQLLAERQNYSQIMLRIFIDEVTADISSLEPRLADLVSLILAFFHEGVEEGAFRRISSRHFFQSLLGLLFFHYSANRFSGTVIGVEDVFAPDAAAWRSREVERLIRHGILADDGGTPESNA